MSNITSHESDKNEAVRRGSDVDIEEVNRVSRYVGNSSWWDVGRGVTGKKNAQT